MIDVHAHILPGLDDGPAAMDEAVAMARLAAADGISCMVATPHYPLPDRPLTPGDLERARRELEQELAAQGVPLELRVAAELQVAADLPERIHSGRAPSLDGLGRYALVEFPRLGHCAAAAAELVFRLQLEGITPLIAHPEHCETFLKDLALVRQLVEQGALFQVTASSVLREAEAPGFVFRLLREGLAQILATDTHDSVRRPPLLARARDVCATWLGPERAEQLVTGNPRCLVAGEPLAPFAPAPSDHPKAARPGRTSIRSTLDRLRNALHARPA